METIDDVLQKEQIQKEHDQDSFQQIIDQMTQKALDREIANNQKELTDEEVLSFERWYLACILEHYHEIFQ